MNFGLMISNNVETKLEQVVRDEAWDQSDEAREYERCLGEVLEEHGRAWADGNVRIGDYILLIDSDTRVPSDCLLDGVSEMEQSPEVGIMQFSSGVMNVTGTYFENGIVSLPSPSCKNNSNHRQTFFTNLIYMAIKYTVSNGDVAPFVGHNAILRWSAIQQIGYFDEDGYEKFWSEHHVSEDFEMSLKLQTNGYIIRLAAWAGEGFKEGVSLTVYDELARWEKYAYGCNELLFWPIHMWIYKGLVTSPNTAILSLYLLTLLQQTFHAPVPEIPLLQHPLYLQGHHHLLHWNLLRHRCRLDPDRCELFCDWVVQWVPRQVLCELNEGQRGS